jgi:zinc protease
MSELVKAGVRALAIFGVALLLSAARPAWSQTQAQTQRRATEFSLGNGMQVVVIPDRRAPVITHVVWYRIGGADNIAGQSGLAHFLEHLMFKSTGRLKTGELSNVVARLGGRDNAVTTHDATYYFQRLPKEHLKTAMTMEADRMRNLKLIDQEVATERQVVIQERRSVVDSKSLAILDELISAGLYLNHPYRIPVIGWGPEIPKLSRQLALEFYNRFYAPNNAILIVAGDVTEAEVRKLAQDTFGRVRPRAGLARPPRPAEPPQLAARRIELRDPRAGSLSMQRFYLAPSYKTAQPGEAEALDVLVTILGEGPTSRLYGQLVEDKNVAANAGASYSGVALDSGTINVYAIAGDGVKQAALEQGIDAVLAQFIKEGPSEEELEQAKSSLIASYIYSADNQASLAQRYGSNLVIGRTIADVEDWPARLARVSAADVKKAAAKYLDLQSSVTGFLIPQEEASEAAAGEKRGEARQ